MESVTSPRWPEQTFADRLASHDHSRPTLVSEGDFGVEGFLFARLVAGQCEIESIVVAAKVQRKGIGCGLMRTLLAMLRVQTIKRVFLEVRESNTAARGLYEKCGFAVVGRRKKYYRDPAEDALLYTLELGSELP